MKIFLASALILLAGFAAVPAHAYTTEQMPVDSSGTARFSDPDEPLDALSDQLDAQDSASQTRYDSGHMANWLRTGSTNPAAGSDNR